MTLEEQRGWKARHVQEVLEKNGPGMQVTDRDKTPLIQSSKEMELMERRRGQVWRC